MPPKRIAMLVEGDGDVAAAPVLVKRLLKEMGVATEVIADSQPLRIGGIENISGRKRAAWLDRLRLAARLRRAEGVLLLEDGDSKQFEGKPFCVREVAAELHRRARDAGAGVEFSAACVFACMEYESWFLACVPALAGAPLPDGRPGIKPNARFAGDTETRRGAKEELGKLMVNGYRATTDQRPLTQMLDFDLLRQKGCRSFRRLESALRQLVDAVTTGKHIPLP